MKRSAHTSEKRILKAGIAFCLLFAASCTAESQTNGSSPGNTVNGGSESSAADPAENTPSPEVQSVIWTHLPDMDLETVYPIAAEPEMMFVHAVRNCHGYPVEWVDEEHDPGVQGYTGNAVAVKKGGLYGVMDYDGNILYDYVIQPEYDSFSGNDNPIREYYYNGFGYQWSFVFMKDFRSVVQKECGGIGGDWPMMYMVSGVPVYGRDDIERNADLSDEPDMIAMPSGTTYQEALDGQKWAVWHPDGTISDDFPGKADKFINGYVRYCVKGRYGFVDGEQNTVITGPVYQDTLYFTDGYCAVKRGTKWGFINTSGNEVTGFVFEDVSSLYEGKAYVKYKGRYGILDLKATLEQGIPVNNTTLNTQ